MDFLNELNDSQRIAVTDTEGAQLVIAGAGSGKTRVLTYKIAYLLSQGVSPSNILALTFTNKAAREMKSRIGQLVGQQYARYLWMGTFHSIFSRILRQEADRLGYTHDYTIYDSTDSKSMIKQIIKEMQLDEKVYKPGVVASRISMAKNDLLTPQDYSKNNTLLQEDRLMRIPRTVDIFFTYNQRLKQSNAMDFDDLLFNMNLLLQRFDDLRDKYQQIFRYILVDEYQDTNHCQAHIVLTLAQPQQNICVIGDDAQSIYSFRGANIDNILRFKDSFSGAKLYKLERNYRSTQNIVGAANSLIKKNKGQIPKEVYSEKEQGELLKIKALENDRNEGEYIAKEIYSRRREGYDAFAVLYRTNAQSRIIEDELRKRSIPYRIYGSVSFYQRKEIKDALGYLRLMVNPQDDEALLRVINFPSRGIGETTMRRVLDTAHTAGVSAYQVVSQPEQYGLQVSAATQNRLRQFAQLTERLREKRQSMDAYSYAEHVLRDTGVLMNAMADKTPEGQDRYENLQELLSGIREFVETETTAGNPAMITDFLAEVSLLTDQDEHLDDDTARVSLMTIHAAKGLEFPIVFIAGMEEKLFPSVFAESVRELEEERRLFYVAMTRAERECITTYARQRWRNGSVTFSTPSRFLKDIDSQFVDRSGEQQTQTETSWSMGWMQQEFEGFHRSDYSRSSENSHHGSHRQPSTYTSWEQPQASSSRPMKRVEKKTGNASTAQPLQNTYKEGDRIRHATFGEGTVVSAYSEYGNDKVDIQFDHAGKKTLLLKFARLEKLPADGINTAHT